MKYLVTGVAGFIGSATAEKLNLAGHEAIGIDNLNDYYFVILKHARLARIKNLLFKFGNVDIVAREAMAQLFAAEKFDQVIHLAAQAGVRYSLENPYAYADSILVGHLNIQEGCRQNQMQHLVYASSSSVSELVRWYREFYKQ